MGIVRKTLMISLLVILFVGCKNESKSYYNNGNIKSICELNKNNQKNGFEKVFYETGELMMLQHFENGKQIDSTLNYYKDGTLKSIFKLKNDSLYCKTFKNNILIGEGKIDSLSRPVGWWNYYANKQISSKEENIIVEGKSVINREKAYIKNSFIIHKSRYYNLIKPNLINPKKEVLLKFIFNFYENKIEKNIFEKEYYYLLVSPEINKDFSNLNNLVLDTTVNKSNQFDFYIEFKKPGKKTIRGIIEKHTLIKDKDKVFIKKSRMYVNETIDVF